MMGGVGLLINGGGVTAFCESYHKIDATILRRSVHQI